MLYVLDLYQTGACAGFFLGKEAPLLLDFSSDREGRLYEITG